MFNIQFAQIPRADPNESWRIMPIDFDVQNLAQVVWIIIIVLNIYVLMLLYRVAKEYRVERVTKLTIAREVRQKIKRKRQIWLKSFNTKKITESSSLLSSYLSNCTAESDFNHTKSSTKSTWWSKPIKQRTEKKLQSENCRQQQRQKRQPKQQLHGVQQRQQQSQQQQFFKRPSVISPSPSPSSSSSPRMLCSRASILSGKLRQEDYPSDSNNLHRLLIMDSYGHVIQEIPFYECDYAEAVHATCRCNNLYVVALKYNS
uniref:Uncharacterized protein n=1 Tax=Glossina brevipalpis TaxID=37001 RepID=A0A1A9VZX6_9MUSC